MALVVFRETAVSVRTPSLVHGFELLSLVAPVLSGTQPGLQLLCTGAAFPEELNKIPSFNLHYS